MTLQPIYLDYAAATPLDPRVLAAMQPYFTENFYNPSSPYLAARAVKADVEAARGRIAHWLGARAAEIIFTAGATESVNLAIHGVMRAYPDGELLVASTEHDAVLATAKQYNAQLVAVLPDGRLDQEALLRHITDKTVLISIGLANSETGTIQPIHQIAQLIAGVRRERVQRGIDRPLLFHSDASQGAGYLDLHVARLGVDLLTLNGGKIYGPKQTGILYVKSGLVLSPLVSGGGQENGLRSGTQNVAGLIGFAAALDIAQTGRKEAAIKHTILRDQLQYRLQSALPQSVVNGSHKNRLPNNLHISFPDVDGERLVMLLDERGVQASTGSACAANKGTASHVLRAMGLPDDLVQGSLRLSIGEPTTQEDVEQAAVLIVGAVGELQG